MQSNSDPRRTRLANKFRGLVIGAIVVCGISAFAPGTALAGTLDQQQTSSNEAGPLLTTQSLAQTFTAGISGGLDQADLKLEKTGTPPALTVEIRSTSAGTPTSTILATGTIPSSAVTSGQFASATFDTPAPVTAGTQYALVAWAAGTAGTNFDAWDDTDLNPYAGGSGFASSAPFPPVAGWNQISAVDFAFKTYVVPTPAESPPPVQPITQSGVQPTGLRAAGLKRCKKVAKKKNWSSSKLRKCKRRANALPV
jgi:hypothetical protein